MSTKEKIFGDILKTFVAQNERISQHQITNITQPGENYCSEIYKLDIILEDTTNNMTKPVNGIFKCMIPTLSNDFKLFTLSLFRNEIGFYTDIAPTIRQFELENLMDTSNELFPKLLGFIKNKHGNNDEVDEDVVIILENLKTKGYSNLDPVVGFDLEGAKLVLKDLARFHALTIALKFKKPDVFQNKIRKHCQPAHFPESITLRNLTSKGWSDAVLNQAKCKPYQDQLKKRLDMELDNMNFLGYRPVNEPYATLIQNDMWTNNTMQVIENGKLVKNKFLDFQAYLYATPFCDVIFFIWSSVQIPIVENHYEELVKHYHHHFFRILEDFGCDTVPFEYEKVLQQIEKVAPHELIHILYLAALIYVDKGEAYVDFSRDLDEIMSENIGEAVAKRIEYAVSEFGKRGWIDLK